MQKTNMRALVSEAFQKTLRKNTNEAFGIFGRRKEEPTGMSASDWDMRARHHRNMTVKHTELAHEFDQRGNREAGDYHTMAADAHSKAARALHYHRDDPEGYERAAAAAHNASREANMFLKEGVDNLSEVSYTDENGDTMYYYGDDMGRAFKHVADKYKNRETGTVNHRSAPDTSKFTAPAYGMIQHLQNIQVAREHPFRPHRFDHFIKIGSNVDRDTADEIKSDIHDYLMDTGHTSVDYKGNPTGELGNYSKDYIRTVDKHGNPYTLKTVSGTAWGGIGVVKGHE